MYWVYVIQNPKGGKYTGSTENLENRLSMHNDCLIQKAKFHKTTYKKGPWHIIFAKDFLNRKDALEFERYLKTGKGREWLESAPALAGNDEV